MKSEGPRIRSKGKRKTAELRTKNMHDVNVNGNVDIADQRVENPLEVLMKTEFGSMVCALKDLNKMDFWKAPKVLEYIISSFVKDNTFKVAGQTLESSPDNLAVIFLMKRFKMSKADRERYGPKEDPTLRDSDFYKEYFLVEVNSEEDEIEEPNKKKKPKKKKVDQEDLNKKPEKKKSEVKLEKSRILKEIKHAAKQEGKEEDFVKLLVLYMFCTLFFTNCNSMYVHYKYLNCMQSVDRMNMISWPDEIHEHLMESIASVTRNKSKTHTVTGCTVYLLLWFLEHVRNIKRKPDSDNLPRFSRWNLYVGSSELEGMLESLSKEQVSEKKIVAFTDEEKKLCTFEESEVQTLKCEVQELKNEVKVKDKIILDLKGESEALKSQVKMLRENTAPRTPLHGGSPLPVLFTPLCLSI
ncbi:hypothetical protein MKW98_028064 [Papaver atlanticum]|uniref:Uncharacterized protein n=1 Tax=Papaver atlanticum TaxID=357466 RepID=A0AAD4XLP0_9MAGN|nr:hypothetical protein MKW98_028064 [Papaver atlanticum]